uniref:Uncharacterized protein n=1 Tax=Arion vulgaris TaxID=1028688 RepID=A0A0B7AHH7_9EUPU
MVPLNDSGLNRTIMEDMVSGRQGRGTIKTMEANGDKRNLESNVGRGERNG